jgi:hypothetical protein
MCGDTPTLYPSLSVWATNCLRQYVFCNEWLDGPKNLGLLVAHCVNLKRAWRLHCREGHQLHPVTGYHIAQCADFVIKHLPALYTEAFADGYLHVINVPAVPGWFKDAVGKTKDQDVLDGFFAEIMASALHMLARVKVIPASLVPRIHNALLVSLQDPDSAVRQYAGQWIAALVDNAAAPNLETAITNESDELVRHMEESLETLKRKQREGKQ